MLVIPASHTLSYTLLGGKFITSKYCVATD